MYLKQAAIFQFLKDCTNMQDSAAARFLKNRMMAVTCQLITSLDSMALQRRLRDIGTMKGSTTPKSGVP